MGLVSFVQRGVEDDNRKFVQAGIDPISPEATPYYVRWIREDLVGIFYLTNRATILVSALLVLIAYPFG